jgi:hypothetical protein
MSKRMVRPEREGGFGLAESSVSASR